jgi:hypothetical protein
MIKGYNHAIRPHESRLIAMRLDNVPELVSDVM